MLTDCRNVLILQAAPCGSASVIDLVRELYFLRHRLAWKPDLTDPLLQWPVSGEINSPTLICSILTNRNIDAITIAKKQTFNTAVCSCNDDINRTTRYDNDLGPVPGLSHHHTPKPCSAHHCTSLEDTKNNNTGMHARTTHTHTCAHNKTGGKLCSCGGSAAELAKQYQQISTFADPPPEIQRHPSLTSRSLMCRACCIRASTLLS